MKKENLFYFDRSKLLSIDIETKDPNLVEMGPGTHRGDGHICGLSISSYDLNGNIVGEYLSFTHPDTPSDEREKNRKIAKSLLKTSKPKIGANIAYDIEWLNHEGFKVGGKSHDIQYGAALLDEYKRSYSLNSVAKDAGLQPKKTDVLQEYCDTMNWKGEPIKHIWRMPSSVAAEYALVDTALPLEIFELQKQQLEHQNMWSLYNLEIDLIPVLLNMRRNGVRVDMDLFRRTIVSVNDVIYHKTETLSNWAGRELNFNSTSQLAKLFDEKGISYPRRPPTAKMLASGKTEGNPCLDKSVLRRLAEEHPMCQELLDLRHYSTINNLFLYKWANMLVGDRLYAQFHPLRNDEYGTVSGRFSASKPNLQQVSSADDDPEFNVEGALANLKGKILRRLFLPEEGKKWAKLDYSQVEYRIMAHYASGRGAEELRQTYIDNPLTDYHQRVMDLTGFDRKTAKNVNFGGAYGVGIKTASTLFGWTIEEAELFLNGYHRAAPYIRTTRNAVSNVISRRGYIHTILGRRARLGGSRKLHSFFNRLIQGSAADIMKKSMVDAYKKGLFDVLDITLDTAFLVVLI